MCKGTGNRGALELKLQAQENKESLINTLLVS
jgi:hypothetical protein